MRLVLTLEKVSMFCMVNRFWRSIMFGNLMVAVSLVIFWIAFYAELIFPIDVLSARILHFEGYYAWETSFTVPDLVLAITLFWSAQRLLVSPYHVPALIVLSASAGAMMFLGILDFTYGIRHGMYELDHLFSWILLAIGLGLPVWGVLNIWFTCTRLKKL